MSSNIKNSSKSCSLKKFYENFKEELSEDDFEVEEVYVLEEILEEFGNIPPPEEVAQICLMKDDSIYVLDSSEEEDETIKQYQTRLNKNKLKVFNARNSNRSPKMKDEPSISKISQSVLKVSNRSTPKKKKNQRP